METLDLHLKEHQYSEASGFGPWGFWEQVRVPETVPFEGTPIDPLKEALKEPPAPPMGPLQSKGS